MSLWLLMFAGCSREPFQSGLASWYGPGLVGRLTASGEVFDPQQLTAAHLTLPFGTEIEVVRADSGESVRVVINDRGPFVEDRVLDLSEGAAADLGLLDVGTTLVEIHVD